MSKKQPVKKEQVPAYPSLRQSSLGRRHFLSLLGGASLVLLGSGVARSETGRETIADASVDRPPEPKLAGVPRRPDLEFRLPPQGTHPARLKDQSSISYVLFGETASRDYQKYAGSHSDDLLPHVDRVLRSYFDYQLSDEGERSKVEQDICEVLNLHYQREHPNISPVSSVTLKLGRLQNPIAPGGACLCRPQPASASGGLPWLLLLGGLPLLHRLGRKQIDSGVGRRRGLLVPPK